MSSLFFIIISFNLNGAINVYLIQFDILRESIGSVGYKPLKFQKIILSAIFVCYKSGQNFLDWFPITAYVAIKKVLEEVLLSH